MKLLLCTLTVILLLGATIPYALPRPDIPPNRKIDSYGDVSFKDEKARLDAFLAELKKEPDSQGYIMAYAGKRARRGEAAARGRRAQDYLVNVDRECMDARRIVVVDGGYRERLTVELFLVPAGGIPPRPEPTVDPSEVQIIGSRGKGRRVRFRP